MLEFFLVDNHLTEDPDDCRAITQHKKTITMDQLMKLIMLRGAGLTESEISSVLQEYFVAMEYFLEEGNRIVTPFFNITSTVCGVFENNKASFEKGKHRIKINVTAGVQLKKVADKIGAEKIRGNKNVPYVDDAYDFASDSTDDILTPGQPLRLTEEYLKLDPKDAAQGLFFVNMADQVESRASMYMESRNKQISLMVPGTLSSGNYTLKIRAYMGNEIRVGEFSSFDHTRRQALKALILQSAILHNFRSKLLNVISFCVFWLQKIIPRRDISQQLSRIAMRRSLALHLTSCQQKLLKCV